MTAYDVLKVELARINKEMEDLSDDERMELCGVLMEGYCTYCGRKCEVTCNCTRDE